MARARPTPKPRQKQKTNRKPSQSSATTQIQKKSRSRPTYRSRFLSACFSIAKSTRKKHVSLAAITRYLSELSERKPDDHPTLLKHLVKKAKESLLEDQVLTTSTGHGNSIELDTQTKSQIQALRTKEGGNDSSDDERAAAKYLSTLFKPSPTPPTKTTKTRKRSKPTSAPSSSSESESDTPPTRPKPQKKRAKSTPALPWSSSPSQPRKGLLRLTKAELAERIEKLEVDAKAAQTLLDANKEEASENVRTLEDGLVELRELCDSYKQKLEKYERGGKGENVGDEEDADEEERDELEDDEEFDDEALRRELDRRRHQAQQHSPNQQEEEEDDDQDLGGMDPADFIDDSGYYSQPRQSSVTSPTSLDALLDPTTNITTTSSPLKFTNNRLLSKPLKQISRTHSWNSTRLPSPALSNPSFGQQQQSSPLRMEEDEGLLTLTREGSRSKSPLVSTASKLPTPELTSSPEKNLNDVSRERDAEEEVASTVVHDEASTLEFENLKMRLEAREKELEEVNGALSRAEMAKVALGEEVEVMARTYQDSQLSHSSELNLSQCVSKPSTHISTSTFTPKLIDVSTSTSISYTTSSTSTGPDPALLASQSHVISLTNSLSTLASELHSSQNIVNEMKEEVKSKEEAIEIGKKKVDEVLKKLEEVRKVVYEKLEEIEVMKKIRDEMLEDGKKLRRDIKAGEKKSEALTAEVENLEKNLQTTTDLLSTSSNELAHAQILLRRSSVHNQLLTHFLTISRSETSSHQCSLSSLQSSLSTLLLPYSSQITSTNPIEALSSILEHQSLTLSSLETSIRSLVDHYPQVGSSELSEIDALKSLLEEFDLTVRSQGNELVAWEGMKELLGEEFGVEFVGGEGEEGRVGVERVFEEVKDGFKRRKEEVEKLVKEEERKTEESEEKLKESIEFQG